MPDPRDPRLTIERETLKLVVQHPRLSGSATKDVGGDDFTHPAYRAVWETIARAGGPSAAGSQWATDLRSSADDPTVQSLLSAVAVEALLTGKEPDENYAATHVYRLQELTALRRIADLKSKLQRTNPVEHATEYNRMFGELVALEQHRRTLRELAVGGS
jgi:DNA primase